MIAGVAVRSGEEYSVANCVSLCCRSSQTKFGTVSVVITTRTKRTVIPRNLLMVIKPTRFGTGSGLCCVDDETSVVCPRFSCRIPRTQLTPRNPRKNAGASAQAAPNGMLTMGNRNNTTTELTAVAGQSNPTRNRSQSQASAIPARVTGRRRHSPRQASEV